VLWSRRSVFGAVCAGLPWLSQVAKAGSPPGSPWLATWLTLARHLAYPGSPGSRSRAPGVAWRGAVQGRGSDMHWYLVLSKNDGAHGSRRSQASRRRGPGHVVDAPTSKSAHLRSAGRNPQEGLAIRPGCKPRMRALIEPRSRPSFFDAPVFSSQARVGSFLVGSFAFCRASSRARSSSSESRSFNGNLRLLSLAM
jgi:hypothetical protein